MVKVLTGGAFDLLHVGHIRFLERAKELGDHLVVHVASDKMVANKKGQQRPIIPWEQRRKMVNSLKCVDQVITLDSDKLDIDLLLTLVQPDILVLIEGENVENGKEKAIQKGVNVIELSRTEGIDTTSIINKIRSG